MEPRLKYNLELLDLLLYLKLKILLEGEFSCSYTQLSYTNKTPLDIICCLDEINKLNSKGEFEKKIIDYSLKKNKYTSNEEIINEPHIVRLEAINATYSDGQIDDDEITIRLLDKQALEALIDQEMESFSKNTLERHASSRTFYGIAEQEKIVFERIESIKNNLKNSKFPFFFSSISDFRVDVLRVLLLLKKKNKIAISRTWNERKRWLTSRGTGRANLLSGAEYESVPDTDKNCVDIEVFETKEDEEKDVSFLETNKTSNAVESINNQEAAAQQHKLPFKLRAGTTWTNITLELFEDSESVRILVNGKTIDLDFARMGFEDGRSGKPNKQWIFLKAFAVKNGELPLENVNPREDLSKRKELLTKTLQNYFTLDSDPFHPYYEESTDKEKKSYKIKMKLIYHKAKVSA